MAITFRVDDVSPATTAPPTLTLGEHLGAALAIGGDAGMRVLDTRGTHPLLAAVHAAFAEHRPLVLSPDAIWLTIAQGFAQHVRLHAEALRPRLVRHQGRSTIEVEWNGPLPEDPASWSAILDTFRGALADRIGEGRARTLVCDFSTTTPVDRVASEIVLLDAYSPYFDYVLSCVCGIPEITLLGTSDDWRAIRARVDVLAELDLGFWTASLAPIADKLVEAAAGRPDIAFFRRIYKPKEAYGRERITGWIARLYPYVGSRGRFDEPNPLLALPLDWEPPADGEPWYNGPGITSDSVPARASSCLLDVHDATSAARHDVMVEGGLMAVEVDDAGCLRPRAAFRIRRGEASIGAVIDAMRAHPRVSLEAAAPSPDDGAFVGLPAELRALHDACGGAHLFDGWRLRPLAEHQPIEVAGWHVTRFLDLPDGTFLAFAVWGEPLYVRLRSDALTPLAHENERPEGIDEVTGLRRDELQSVTIELAGCPAARSSEACEDIPVVGNSVAAILALVLRSEGATELPVVSSLSDALPAWMRSGQQDTASSS
ncbi:hypothetical protein BE08_42820 [Sorangium cellulosum]|uniref:Uncharacterized protein n=1 Tax=Sorangium cellulosum TaxID=56 RepID=A0A150PJA9_SORCE|nr:hypothetical protein BE08_42820 [Sorangium cellulosum]